MKQKTYHLWMLIGVIIFQTLTVDSFEFEKIKNRNHLNKLPTFERVYPSIANAGSAGSHIQEGSSLHDISTLNKSLKRDNETERKENNETEQIVKSNIKNIENKFYNKKRMLHPSKLEDKSHAKRENFFFRLFSDNYKPHKLRPLKKRDANGLIRKLDIVNDTIFPPISHSVKPLSHFGRDRKLNDDKICKTQIIKFFPKQIRKSYETKNDIGNESHRQLLFNDNNNNEWELRQDIFVEEILPFREKNDFGFKDIFHDEAKNIFDDILSIFTMLPFSIFDTIYVKLSTTEKPKMSSQEGIEHAEKLDYDDATYFIDSLRNKRQAIGSPNQSSSSKAAMAQTNLKENINMNTTKDIDNSSIMTGAITDVTNTKSVKILEKQTTNATSDKVQTTNTVDANGVLTANYKPVNAVDQTNATESEKAKTTATESEKTKTITDAEKLKPAASSQYELNSSTDVSASTSTVAELSKQKILNPKEVEMLEMSENDGDHYDENLKNSENVEEAEPSNDKNAFLMVLGVIPGLVGLIIAVGVVGIWMIQKNSSWVERNNQGNEPTTSQTKPPHSMNI